MPSIQESGLLPGNETAGDSSSSGVKQDGDSVNSTVNVDVNTQITDVVEKVSPAVVGVVNLQRQGDFWQQQQEDQEAGTGSGVIYKKKMEQPSL